MRPRRGTNGSPVSASALQRATSADAASGSGPQESPLRHRGGRPHLHRCVVGSREPHVGALERSLDEPEERRLRLLLLRGDRLGEALDRNTEAAERQDPLAEPGTMALPQGRPDVHLEDEPAQRGVRSAHVREQLERLARERARGPRLRLDLGELLRPAGRNRVEQSQRAQQPAVERDGDQARDRLAALAERGGERRRRFERARGARDVAGPHPLERPGRQHGVEPRELGWRVGQGVVHAAGTPLDAAGGEQVLLDGSRGHVLQDQPRTQLRGSSPELVVGLLEGAVQVGEEPGEPDLAERVRPGDLRAVGRADADPEQRGELGELEARAIGRRVPRLRRGDSRGVDGPPGVVGAALPDLGEQVAAEDPGGHEHDLEQGDLRTGDRVGPDTTHAAQDQAEQSQHDERQPEREHPRMAFRGFPLILMRFDIADASGKGLGETLRGPCNTWPDSPACSS